MSSAFFKIILLLFLLHCLYAQPEWKAQRFIELKKDDFYVMTFRANDAYKTLFFRWTLQKNEGLVVHLNYDRYPHQFVLYTDYKRACYQVPLMAEEQRFYEPAPFLLLCYKDYDRLKRVASLRYSLFTGARDLNVIDERIEKNGGFNSY